MPPTPLILFFFFLNDPAPTEISPLPLPAPFPICRLGEPVVLDHEPVELPQRQPRGPAIERRGGVLADAAHPLDLPLGHRREGGDVGVVAPFARSEEHTSELQSLAYLVCRLLLEKK